MENKIKCDLCNVFIHKNHFNRHEKSIKHIINLDNQNNKPINKITPKKQFNKRIISEFIKHGFMISDVTKNEQYTDERCIKESDSMKCILIVHENMNSHKENIEPYDVILFYKNNHVLGHYKNVDKLIQKMKNDLHIDKTSRECNICMNDKNKFFSCETCFKEACSSCVFKCLHVDDRSCSCCPCSKKKQRLYLHNGYYAYTCCFCRERTFIKKDFFH